MDPRRDGGGAHLSAPEPVYEERFSAREHDAREAVWREIARYLQRHVVPDAPVLDIAADRGAFVRNVDAPEKWASDLRDTSAFVGSDVRFVQSDGLSLGARLPNEHFGTVFMSNYLEHLPSPDAVLEQLRVARRLLRPGGRLIVLQPNIRLVGARYWDYIDHRVPLTERSLVEAATVAGFRTVTLVARFLPYTVKGRLPSHRWLVRAYLGFRPAWWLLGRQTLYVGARDA